MVYNIKRLRLPHYNTMIISMLLSTHSKAIKLITDNEMVINNIWKKTLILLLLYRKIPFLLQTTRSNHLCIAKNNWTSIIHKIRTNEENIENILPSLLFQLILFEFSFCNGLCGSKSNFIYIISTPVARLALPTELFINRMTPERIITNDMEICDRHGNTRFFPLDSVDNDYDDDNDESPLLCNKKFKLSKKSKSVFERIKSIFHR